MKLEKVTKRVYDDACGTAHALDLVGERWAMLVMRELMFGPRRFGDLRSDMPGLSANVLTQRLEGLEAAGVVRRRKLAPPASVQVYELTPWGYEAEPFIRELGRWGARSPTHDPDLPLSNVSLMMSLHTMFDAKPGDSTDVTVAFRFGAERFVASVQRGVLNSARDEGGPADVEISGSAGSVADVVYGFATLEREIAEGRLALAGDPNAFLRFATWFDLPPKAGAPA